MIDPNLDKIRQRLIALRAGLFSKDFISFPYEEAIFNFRVTAAISHNKEAAKIIIEDCSNILSEIFANRNKILSGFTKFTDFEVIENGTEKQFDEESFQEIDVPTYKVLEKQIVVNGTIRNNLYKKHIQPELFQYYKLFERYSETNDNIKVPISEDTAIKIASIEVGEKGRFIQTGSSQEMFIELLTNVALSKTEINGFKIQIAVTAQQAGYMFTKLFEANILNFSAKDFDELGCFYNKNTLLKIRDIRSSNNKFQKQIDKRNPKALQVEVDLIDAIEKIIQSTKS